MNKGPRVTGTDTGYSRWRPARACGAGRLELAGYIAEAGGGTEQHRVGPGQVAEAGLGDVGGVPEVLTPGLIGADRLRVSQVADVDGGCDGPVAGVVGMEMVAGVVAGIELLPVGGVGDRRAKSATASYSPELRIQLLTARRIASARWKSAGCS